MTTQTIEPFTTAEALEAGLTRAMLSGPRFRRLFKGLYVPADQPLDLALWITAARRLLDPDARLTGVAALRWHGLDVGSYLPLEFVTAAAHNPRRTGILATRVLKPPHGGTADVFEAWTHACRRLPVGEAVALGDRLIHLGMASITPFENLAAGRRKASVPAALVRAGSESVAETRLRLTLVLAGLPEPDLNVTLGGAHDAVGRVDGLYRRERVVLEYEGDHHRTDRVQWNRDIHKHRALESHGYLVVRITNEDALEPERIVSTVHGALVRRGYRGRVPVLTPQWRDLRRRVVL